MRVVPAVVVAVLVAAACSSRTPERAATTPLPISATPQPTAAPPSTPAPTRVASSGRNPFELARSFDASTPAELNGLIVGAEGTLRTSKIPRTLRDSAMLQQAAYRQLVRQPEWRKPVLDELPRAYRPVAAANIEAGAELRKLTAPRTELPPWKIVKPPPRAELLRVYRAAAEEFGVDWEYLAAIHLVETRMGRIRGDSVAGAKGPMQFLPSTWARWGEGNIEDPHDAIRAAARYLKGHGAPQDMSRALFAYNHSDHYVRAIELYAEQMRRDARSYNGYYYWQVYYRTTKGDALLYEGWPDK